MKCDLCVGQCDGGKECQHEIVDVSWWTMFLVMVAACVVGVWIVKFFEYFLHGG